LISRKIYILRKYKNKLTKNGTKCTVYEMKCGDVKRTKDENRKK
jgi:hypothetical protein